MALTLYTDNKEMGWSLYTVLDLAGFGVVVMRSLWGEREEDTNILRERLTIKGLVIIQG